MFDFSTINYWAVLVAGVAQFVIGMLWYSPAMFGNAWMKMVGITKSDIEKAKKKGMAGEMIAGFVFGLVTASVLALILPVFGASDWQNTLQIVFWLWLGLMGAGSTGMVLWENRPKELWLLNNAYTFVIWYVMSLVLVYWV